MLIWVEIIVFYDKKKTVKEVKKVPWGQFSIYMKHH